MLITSLKHAHYKLETCLLQAWNMLVTSSVLKQNKLIMSLLQACNKLKWANKYEFVFETEQTYNGLTIAWAPKCELANCEFVFETERTCNELTIARACKCELANCEFVFETEQTCNELAIAHACNKLALAILFIKLALAIYSHPQWKVGTITLSNGTRIFLCVMPAWGNFVQWKCNNCKVLGLILFAGRLAMESKDSGHIIYVRIRHSIAHVWTILNKMASFGVNIYRPSASEHGQI